MLISGWLLQGGGPVVEQPDAGWCGAEQGPSVAVKPCQAEHRASRNKRSFRRWLVRGSATQSSNSGGNDVVLCGAYDANDCLAFENVERTSNRTLLQRLPRIRLSQPVDTMLKLAAGSASSFDQASGPAATSPRPPLLSPLGSSPLLLHFDSSVLVMSTP